MACRQSRDLVPLSKQKRVRSHHKSANLLLEQRCKCLVDVGYGAGIQDLDL
jgi:hypothetical protein